MFHSMLYSLIIPAVSPFFERSISLIAVLHMTCTCSPVQSSAKSAPALYFVLTGNRLIYAGIYVISGHNPKCACAFDEAADKGRVWLDATATTINKVTVREWSWKNGSCSLHCQGEEASQEGSAQEDRGLQQASQEIKIILLPDDQPHQGLSNPSILVGGNNSVAYV